MGRYTKIPEVVEAIQYDGNNITEIGGLISSRYSWSLGPECSVSLYSPRDNHRFSISPYDWVIKDGQGLISMCQNEHFANIYRAEFVPSCSEEAVELPAGVEFGSIELLNSCTEDSKVVNFKTLFVSVHHITGDIDSLKDISFFVDVQDAYKGGYKYILSSDGYLYSVLSENEVRDITGFNYLLNGGHNCSVENLPDIRHKNPVIFSPTSPSLDNRWQTPHLMEKTLNNPVPYASLFGSDTFKLISQEQSEGCTSYTKAMEIVGVGCVVKVTTHRESPDVYSYSVAEALTFVPCSRIEEDIDAETRKVTARHIVGDEQ